MEISKRNEKRIQISQVALLLACGSDQVRFSEKKVFTGFSKNMKAVDVLKWTTLCYIFRIFVGEIITFCVTPPHFPENFVALRIRYTALL